MKNAMDIIKKQIQGSYPDNKFTFTKLDVNLELRDLSYADLDVKDQIPVSIQSSLFENGTSVEDSQTFTVDKSTSDSFTWSITEAIEVSSEFSVKIPFVGDSKTTVKLNFSSTQGQTTSVDRHWGYSAQIPVPPNTSVTTTFSVLEGKINTPFTATFQIRGFMRIDFDISKGDEASDWRYCEGQIADMISGGYCVSDAAKFECSTSGIFLGVAATSYIVKTKTNQQDNEAVFATGEIWDSQPAKVIN